MGVATARPDLLRSWASDVDGVFDPDYVWHEFAQVWQAPGSGEGWVEQMLALPDDEVAALPAAEERPLAGGPTCVLVPDDRGLLQIRTH